MKRRNITATGTQFEDLLLATTAWYWSVRLAYMQRFEVPKKVVGGRAVYTAKTGYDFVGTNFSRGTARSLYVEAKSIDEASLHLLQPGQKGAGLKAHQLFALDTLETMGCECWILWRTGGQVYRMHPSWIIQHFTLGSRIHRALLNDEEHTVQMVSGLPDFLGLQKSILAVHRGQAVDSRTLTEKRRAI